MRRRRVCSREWETSSTSSSAVCSPVADAPKIEFPCDYPIKIIGVSATVFRETVVESTTSASDGFASRENGSLTC
ncbi:MAG: DUF493 family protein [Gammaproteobacteria bacterium]|nr:DUF493 family protein [Gammaproteobacteria bacterium]